MGATAAAYASRGSQIEVYFQKMKYMFDGMEKKPATEQGFIYNGTMYVPLRFVSAYMITNYKIEVEKVGVS